MSNMSRVMVEGLFLGVNVIDDVARLVKNMLVSYSERLDKLVEDFERDLASGVVNVDDYYDAVKKLVGEVYKDVYYFMVNQSKNPESIRLVELSRLMLDFYGKLALHIYRVACGQVDPNVRDSLVLLGESLMSISMSKPLHAFIYLLASIALKQGNKDVAVRLLRKINNDLGRIVDFTCATIDVARMLESMGVRSIPE